MTESAPKQLKVLTLNCWGLKFVAELRRERLLAIAEWIANSSTPSRISYHSDASDEASGRDGYDLIALQEIWVRADFDIVATRAKEAGLMYSRFFYSGAIGAGLAILSAHPIVSSHMSPYPLNGFPSHFLEGAGDFFAGKGVCGVCVDVDGIGLVDVLNTHMYAPGGEAEGIDGAHRVAQAWELSRLAVEKVERGRHVVVMGDLNSQPHSIVIRFLLHHGGLTDAFPQTRPDPPLITSSAHRALAPTEVMEQHGITCDSPLNTYSAPKLAKRGRHDETVIRGGKRLDYVLYRSPASSPSRLVATSTTVVLTGILPAPLSCSYSDHFGLEATLALLPSSSLSTPTPSSHPIFPPPTALSVDDLSRGLANLSGAYSLSLHAARFQLKLFVAALVLVPALAIAASFQTLRWLGWLFVILGVVVGAGGATMLYTGFVGGRCEAGALRNVMEEMEAELVRMRRVAEVGQRWE